ncbi:MULTISPECIES: bile acid:sodium symporter family protein [Marisediminitalea]|jgi:BASS family bile acid:Na+ symporter|uniref:bile acid:sodium symporter family protein n=1 Tax=Marisediminitalea TaxID=2662254 RepID=UPI0020CCC39A|nr:bile acid:sodium symporter family protein [Marisediminitalea aggregata]MCP3864088.1 bile acid:sodium symporter family protein [Aestuariibacter sp.]MCP4236846.1 bile acid:sodium symporter family protein [Aestuariibacter sp.]MCP4529412.1 bile acid:sodium symporter family protein [Aestuariibacter sp.]MCP4949144.1 bile acid:sodium symporter family protein [Aestuariibacter sp.]MCP5013435.1 bile acid:sodium symporter family protein [Aestuariibacter sp.]
MAIFLFPVWAVLVSILAYLFPALFTQLKSWIVPLLVMVMLSMGLTLTWKDFTRIVSYRNIVMVGVAIQFLVMPLAAWLISLLFGLSSELMTGMMLVGATAGGTASNVMTYLARGNVALSVSMTMISTLVAVFMLPLLTWLYLGQNIDVPAASMLTMLVKVIVLPVLAGMLFNHFFSAHLKRLTPWFSRFSILAILLIVAIVVALNNHNLSVLVWPVVCAVMLHNLIGMACGYLAARKLGYDSVIARTVAIEVGMQNSGLSVALALKYFSATSALPGALFSIWHNLSGAMFASYWARKDKP